MKARKIDHIEDVLDSTEDQEFRRRPRRGRDRYDERAVDIATPLPIRRATNKQQRIPSRGVRYSPAIKEQALAHHAQHGAKSASDEYGASIETIHRWQRTRERKIDAGVAQPITATEPSREEQILATWREHPGFGPSQVRNQIKRLGLKASVSTVREIMEDNGYVAPKAKRREHVGRYEAARPRELYHLDFVHFYVHKQKQCLLFIEDDFSRFIVGWALVEVEAADPVIQTFERCVERYGKPEAVMSDRGSAFHSWRGLSRFQALLEEYEVNFFLAKEAAVNGKVEALNAAFQKECSGQIEFTNLTDAARRVGQWVDRYNHQRTHHALGGLLVPADRFYGLAERTLKLIEQGNGAHALDLLNPDNRGLEIFRVTSHGGKAEVYLMGKKIMG